MDRTELEDILREALADVAPNFSLENDESGELVVKLGLKEDPDSEELVPFDAEEDEDYDEDTDPLEDEDEDD
jgi:hypothetical protein